MPLDFNNFIIIFYFEGLGSTVPELEIENYSTAKFEKTQFSMMVPQLWDHMKTLPKV
jgi:hypothetical protein